MWLIGRDDNFVGQFLVFWGIKIQRKRERKIFSKMNRDMKKNTGDGVEI